MATPSQILLSAFADEAAFQKSIREQLTAVSALGLKFYSPRFLDLNGDGNVKHIVDLNKSEYQILRGLHTEFDVSVTSIGSRIGKVKLLEIDDGSQNKHVPFEKYLSTEVDATIQAALELETKLVRGFSFYHPRGTDPLPHIPQAVDQIGKIVERCAKHGLIYGLEIEPNLVGETGSLLKTLVKKVNHPHLVVVFDGGNVTAQNKNRTQCFEEYLEVRDHLGWIHIKDYSIDPKLVWNGVVDENRLKNFVPADVGDAGHETILRDLKDNLSRIELKMKNMGVPGVFLEVEPHLKGGGQFGGYSGPDGLGVAVRALCRVLDEIELGYDLTSFDDIQKRRGY